MEPSFPSHSSKLLPFFFPSSLGARVFPTPSDTEPFLSFSSLPNPNPIHRPFPDVSASVPIDHGYRAAEDCDPLLSSSSSASITTNSYFTEQALRAGYINVGGDIRRGDFMQPITSREALERELQKERIREELIARDIVRRRILEEEVRRELELERAMATRRLQLERYPSAAGVLVHSEVGLERGMQFAPESGIVDGFWPPRVPMSPEDRVHEWSPPPLPPEPVVRRKLPLPHQQPEVSPFRKVQTITTSKPKLSGMKRKSVAVTGGSEIPRPSKKEWSCALCQVSATSKQALDEHLEGKKHKANVEALVEGKKLKATEAPLGANKITKTKKAVGSTSATKVSGKSSPTGGASTNGSVKNQREDKKQQTVQKKSYCCDLCKVKCNSEVMLASHLRGKKHIAQLEESEKNAKPVMPANAGKKVKLNQTAKRAEVEEEVKRAEADNVEQYKEPENAEVAEVGKLSH